MDSVGAKRWLQRAYYLDREINALIAARERAMEDACRVTGQVQQVKVQASRGNRQEDVRITLADYTAMIDAKIDALYAVKTEIQQAIAQVDGAELRALLTMRYITLCGWRRIAKELGYSVDHVRGHMHRCALAGTAEVIRQKNSPGD